MTNPTLTQAEIDAMEELQHGLYGHEFTRKVKWEVAAKDFIPKAIARIRELDSECVSHIERLLEMAGRLSLLQEQNRWRHIDQERPKSGEICIIWVHKAPYLASYEGDEDSFAWVSVIDNEMVHDLKKYPHWQPLPKKGPQDE